MKKYIQYSLIALAALMGWTSCSDEDEVMQQDKNNVEVKINLAYPVEGYTTKALGDPGVYEDFPAPEYVYVWLVTNNNNGKPFYYAFNETMGNALTWTRPHTSDPSSTERDYYVSEAAFNTTAFNDFEQSNITWARIYVLASKHPLDFVTNISNLQDEEAVKNIIIKAQQDVNRVDLSLRDIYSTPYNLLNKDREYYGTGTIFPANEGENKTNKIVVAFGTGSAPLTLYHVAAKVDFMWEAADHTQETTMKKIEVLNAPTQGYVFKPAKNVKQTSYSDVYTVTPLASTDEGNKWEGRAYTYMLQPEDYTLEYKVTTKKNDGLHVNTLKTTGEDNMTSNQHNIYASWYLIRLNMK